MSAPVPGPHSPSSGSRSSVLRVGAAVLVLAALVLGGIALLVDSSPTTGAVAADDPTDVALPDLGLLGGRVTVYGDATDGEPTAPRDLGCALVDADGDELSSAKMSSFGTSGETVRVEDRTLTPLFSVSSYPDGARVQCDRAAGVAPVAVSAASTFGAFGGAVRGFAAATALLCLVVAGLGLLLARRR